MINDHPDARSLVDQALADFKAHILPLVPKDQRLTGLMIANALGIAARELASHGTTAMASAADVTAAGQAAALMTGAGLPSVSDEQPADTLTRLAGAITAGQLDGAGHQAELRSLLTELTRARVGISNPKLLARG